MAVVLRCVVSTAVGVGVAQGGSLSFTGLDGECVSRSFGGGSAGVQSVGDAQASVDGNVSSQSGCGGRYKRQGYASQRLDL